MKVTKVPVNCNDMTHIVAHFRLMKFYESELSWYWVEFTAHSHFLLVNCVNRLHSVSSVLQIILSIKSDTMLLAAKK